MEVPYSCFENQYPFACVNSSVYDYPCEILPNLLLGPCPPEDPEEKTVKFFEDLKITHIINASSECVYFVPTYISYLHLQLEDDKNVELPFDSVVKFIDTALGSSFSPSITSSSSLSGSSSSFSLSSLPPHPAESPNPPLAPRVLVHCFAGASRSASCVLAYLMYKYRWTLHECAQLVKTVRLRVCPNTGFVKQLREYEKKLNVGENGDIGSNVPFEAFTSEIVKMPLVTKVDFLKSDFIELE